MFAAEINRLIFYIQSEVGKGRMTGIQADVLKQRIKAIEAAHDATPLPIIGKDEHPF